MNNRINLLFARNVINSLTNEEITDIENELYKDDEISCVDAVHFREDGSESEPYTWYIPKNEIIGAIDRGDLLVVEQVVGIHLAIVKAIGRIYKKGKDEHQNDLHPYCKVITVLPTKYNDLNL